MQRCTGPCGRLLLVADFPRRGFGNCWDCFTNKPPTHLGEDPIATPTVRRPAGRIHGF